MSHFKGEAKKYNKITVKEVMSYPVRPIPERKLRLETCQHLGIRSEMSEVTGEVIAHYFPVTKKGEITGFIRRDLEKPKKDAFSTVGDVSVSSDLIGQDRCTVGKKLFICEGVYDYASVWQALRFSAYNENRASPIIPNVVTIGLGTKNAAAHIGNNQEFVSRYEETVIVFDNDSATPEEVKKGVVKGQDAVREVALTMPDIKNVLLDLNDPNEYLVEGRQDELQKKVMFENKEYEAEHIVKGGIGLDVLLEPVHPPLYWFK